ncbi:PREDICTED: protein FAM192A [Tarenaya hassleriana]|uniref:protein FAM192A n=1 Tax=Tarenaya hassleriana TaxID=28532 RepID=UPI00053C6B9D|nr:PREDICTED: protein FAM192A [Tarenaya hassleriana]
MEEESGKPVRLMNFVSEEQLDEAKKARGARVEDGTLLRDKALYEILRENKEKKDAEFNERFKHRPPKALDEDETEFLDKLETTRREYERQMADEEAEQLRSFQAAVAAQSASVQELKEPQHAPSPTQEQKQTGKRNPTSRPLNMIIKVKPQPKKAKPSEESPKDTPGSGKSSAFVKAMTKDDTNKMGLGLVSYCDESEDD